MHVVRVVCIKRQKSFVTPCRRTRDILLALQATLPVSRLLMSSIAAHRTMIAPYRVARYQNEMHVPRPPPLALQYEVRLTEAKAGSGQEGPTPSRIQLCFEVLGMFDEQP